MVHFGDFVLILTNRTMQRNLVMWLTLGSIHLQLTDKSKWQNTFISDLNFRMYNHGQDRVESSVAFVHRGGYQEENVDLLAETCWGVTCRYPCWCKYRKRLYFVYKSPCNLKVYVSLCFQFCVVLFLEKPIKCLCYLHFGFVLMNVWVCVGSVMTLPHYSGLLWSLLQ